MSPLLMPDGRGFPVFHWHDPKDDAEKLRKPDPVDGPRAIIENIMNEEGARWLKKKDRRSVGPRNERRPPR